MEYETNTDEYDIKSETHDNIRLLNNILDTTPPPPSRVIQEANRRSIGGKNRKKNQLHANERNSNYTNKNGYNLDKSSYYERVISKIKGYVLEPLLFMILYYAFHNRTVAKTFQNYFPKMCNDHEGRCMFYYASRGLLMYIAFALLRKYL
jgi:hypothetical protein